jgi:NAD(P)-dependent dehydrogenase (short-subunit alcohol dehydrogenase family)
MSASTSAMTPSPAVVVTGTSTGIGRATANLLDREGFRVFAGVRRPADGESLQSETSPHLTPILLDVTDATSIESAAKQVDAAVGEAGVAGLVNNAGIGFGGPLEFADLDEMRRGFDVNVFGPVAVTRAFLPLLRRAGGRAVNVSSGAGKVSTPLIGPYCASKFALEALSDALRVELRRFGIRVAVVEPGFIDTPMQDKGRSNVDRQLRELPQEALDLYRPALENLKRNFERFGTNATPPEKVAKAILDALTARRPRTRYTVGTDAKLLVPFSRLLPDRAKDAIFGRLLGI